MSVTLKNRIEHMNCINMKLSSHKRTNVMPFQRDYQLRNTTHGSFIDFFEFVSVLRQSVLKEYIKSWIVWCHRKCCIILVLYFRTLGPLHGQNVLTSYKE